MQFAGGWTYPTNAILAGFSIIIVLIVLVLTLVKQSALADSVALFFNLEGTLFIACAFTPVGLLAPEKGGYFNTFKHLLSSQQYGTPVSFDPRIFYSGFGFLLVAAILSFMTK